MEVPMKAYLLELRQKLIKWQLDKSNGRLTATPGETNRGISRIVHLNKWLERH